LSITPVKGREGYYDVRVYERVEAPGEKPCPVCRRVKGKRNAESLERDLLKARDGGGKIGGVPTLAAYIDRYLTSRRREVTAQTLHGYRAVAARYIVPDIGRLPLPAIDPGTVRDFYARLSDKGLAPASVAHVHRVLSMTLKSAMVEGRYITRNPCQVARPPKDDHQGTRDEERGLQQDEAQRLLCELDGSDVYKAAALGLATGLRRSEMLALKWEDVDVKGRELHVTAALEQVGKTVTRRDPKSKRSRRSVPFGDNLAALLTSHRKQQNAARLASPFFWTDEGYVFPSVRITQSQDGGRVWTPSAFSQAWRRAINEVNTRRLGEHVAAGGTVEEFEPPVVGFHDLRHTCATLWLRAGVRDEEVSRRLGHSSSVITRRVYSHATAEEIRDGVDATDALL